jgi:hypothetical protein
MKLLVSAGPSFVLLAAWAAHQGVPDREPQVRATHDAVLNQGDVRRLGQP